MRLDDRALTVRRAEATDPSKVTTQSLTLPVATIMREMERVEREVDDAMPAELAALAIARIFGQAQQSPQIADRDASPFSLNICRNLGMLGRVDISKLAVTSLVAPVFTKLGEMFAMHKFEKHQQERIEDAMRPAPEMPEIFHPTALIDPFKPTFTPQFVPWKPPERSTLGELSIRLVQSHSTFGKAAGALYLSLGR